MNLVMSLSVLETGHCSTNLILCVLTFVSLSKECLYISFVTSSSSPLVLKGTSCTPTLIIMFSQEN